MPDAVQLGGFDQGVGNGGCAATGLQANKKTVFLPDGTGRIAPSAVLLSSSAAIEARSKPLHGSQALADQPAERLGILTPTNPHPLTTRNVELDCSRRRHWTGVSLADVASTDRRSRSAGNTLRPLLRGLRRVARIT